MRHIDIAPKRVFNCPSSSSRTCPSIRPTCSIFRYPRSRSTPCRCSHARRVLPSSFIFVLHMCVRNAPLASETPLSSRVSPHSHPFSCSLSVASSFVHRAEKRAHFSSSSNSQGSAAFILLSFRGGTKGVIESSSRRARRRPRRRRHATSTTVLLEKLVRDLFGVPARPAGRSKSHRTRSRRHFCPFRRRR